MRGLWRLRLKGGRTLARAQGAKDWQGFEARNAGGDFTVNILIEMVVVFLGFLLQSFISVEWSVLILFFL